MSRIRIEAAQVITMNDRGDVIEDGCVVIEGELIAYVGPRRGAPAADQVIEARGRVLMPGLINAHTHLCMIFGRTLGTSVDLLQWLSLQMPVMRALGEQGMYWAQMLGALENLKNGNTTLVENIFAPCRAGADASNAAFRAFRDIGIRATVARAHQTRNFSLDFLETGDQFAEALARLAADWHGSQGGRLQLSMGPLLPWSMTEDSLRRTRAEADRLGLSIHMHVAESAEFNDQIATHFGRPIRQVELLHETGCLGPDVQAVAVADLSDREVELLAETNTSVIFDPQTRLFWGTGYPSVKRFQDAGLVSGLATNGPCSNCGQDLFESMKYACATTKTVEKSPVSLSAYGALRMATIDGARAIGRASEVGSLEVGKQADAITIEMRQPHLTPAHDLFGALVFSARGSDVRDVFVGGRRLLADRQLVHLDEQEVLRACEKVIGSPDMRKALNP